MKKRKKIISFIKTILKSIWSIIGSIDFRMVGAIAVRALISTFFFIVVLMLFPKSLIYWIACCQVYFFVSRLIIAFSGILDFKENNKAFFNRKVKYLLAWEYYFLRDIFSRTFSKNFFNHKTN